MKDRTPFPPSLSVPAHEGIAIVVEAAAERRMLVPLLLFLAGHRPLAFVAGQVLLLCQPLGFVVPGLPVEQLGALLSHPQGPPFLEESLRAALINPPSSNEPRS